LYLKGERILPYVPPESKESIINASLEIFESARDGICTEVQFSYIVQVLDMFEHNQDPSNLTLFNGSTSFLSKEAILKNANRSERLSETVDRIISMAEGSRKYFLESVTETEKAVMRMAFFANIMYGWNVKDGPEVISKIEAMIQSPFMLQGLSNAENLMNGKHDSTLGLRKGVE
jgi:hypothetical protein